MTTSCSPLCLKEFNQTATPPLAPNLFVHPEGAEVQPAVVRVSVGTTENLFALTQPNGHGNLDAISTEWGRMIELFDSVFENLNVVLAGIAIQLDTEVVRSWLVLFHE
jgi:hypothetical protein